MAEIYRIHRPIISGVNENPQPYGRGIAIHAIAGALMIWGAVAESNLAMFGAGALLFGGYEGARWFLSRRRERQEIQAITPPRTPEMRLKARI